MSFVGWLIFSVVIMFVTVLGLSTWIIYLVLGSQKTPKDNPDCITLMPDKTDGFFHGTQLKVIDETPDRTLLEFQPRDFDIDDLEDAKPQRLVVEKNKIYHLPKGILSKRKNIVIYGPRDAEDLPKALRETPIGKIIMLAITAESLNQDERKILRTVIETQKKGLEDLNMGEISEERIKKLMGYFDDAIGSLAKAKDVSKSTSSGGGFKTPELK